MRTDVALRRLRALVGMWPGVVETQSWGHPNWKAGGRQFASFDTYRGLPSICFKADPAVQAMLVDRPHFVLAPYAAARGWVCRTLEEPLDWSELASLVKESYTLVAPRAKAGRKPRARTTPGRRHPKRGARRG